MKIVFCGSGDFGIPTLRRLSAGPHTVVGVITQPPRPAGRGAKLRQPPLAEAAAELGLPVRAAANINDPAEVAAIAALGADAMMVADFGQMIKQPAREAARLGAFNLHGSLLPELRGAAPVNWAIIRGYATTGITVFRLVDRMDAGVMFAAKSTAVSPDETADQLRHRLSELGVEAVLETLAMLEAGQVEGQAQDDSKATRAPLLKKADGIIDWSAPAVAIRNLIHGTWPWPGGQTQFIGAKPVPVTIARASATDAATAGAAPGVLCDDLTVATGAGRLQIHQLKPSGGRLMDWRDFVNGHRVRAGMKFEKTETDSRKDVETQR